MKTTNVDSVAKIMSKSLITVNAQTPFSQARKKFVEWNIHHLPVVDGDRLIGILSYSDILRASFGSAFDQTQQVVDAVLDITRPVRELMQPAPVTIGPTESVRQAAEILSAGRFHALPVVDGDRLVGIVTTTDLARYLVELLQ